MQNPSSGENDKPSEVFEGLFDTRKYDKKVTSAQNAIYIVGAIQMVMGLIVAFAGPDEDMFETIGLYTVISAAFFGLGIWCKYKPFPAIIIALVLYATLWLLVVFITADPMHLIRGVFYRAIVVAFLVKGIIAAKQAQNIRNIVRQD